MKEYLLSFARENKIEVNNETYGHVSQINEIFKSYKMKDFTEDMLKAYPDGVDQITYFLEHPEEGGTSGNFASATTLLYRSLGIPARYVEGYFDINLEGTPTRTVGGLQAHSWVEIYIDSLGWMMVDTSISSVLPPEMAGLLFGKPDIDLNNELGNLEKIEVDIEEKTYFTNSTIDIYKVNINATYSNGVTTKIDFHKPEEYKDSIEGNEGNNQLARSGEMQNLYEVNKANPKQSITIAVGSTYQVGQVPIKVIFKDRDNTSVATIYVEVIEPKIVSLEVDLNSYQEFYMPGNDLNIANLEVLATYNDPKKDKERININSSLVTCEAYENNEISTSIEGVVTYVIYLTNNPDIYTTFEIKVSYKPTDEMNLNYILDAHDSENNPYITVINEFDLTKVELSVHYYYQRSRYNGLHNETILYETSKVIKNTSEGLSYSGDLSKPGITYIDLHYTYGNTMASTSVKVRVRGYDSDLLIDVHNYKIYDGISFEDTEFLTITPFDDENEIVFVEGEHLEYRIVESEIDFKDFYDCGSYSGVIQFRIIDDEGKDLSSFFFKGAEKTELVYYDHNHNKIHEEMHFNEGFFKPDEEGWIDLDFFTFTIEYKSVTIETYDAVYFNDTYYSYNDDLNNTIYVNNRFETIKLSKIVLANGDWADWNNVVFDTLGTNQTKITNRFNPNSLHIYSSNRLDEFGNSIEVTSNYSFTYKWGQLTRG